MRDYYKILGVREEASQQEIKTAYHKLAMTFHPDKNPSSAEKFMEISQAYRVLGKESSRRNYDFLLKYVTYLIFKNHHSIHTTSGIINQPGHNQAPRKLSIYDQLMFVILLIIALFSIYFSITDVITKHFQGMASLSGMAFSIVFTGLLVFGWRELARNG